MGKHNTYSSKILAAAIAAVALQARAAAPDASPAAAAGTVLDEIVVTAEKRTESALKTPIALSTYSGDTLKVSQVITVADLSNVDPSISVNKGVFGNVVSIRGVTSVDTTSKGVPGIAFNVDGIALNRGYEQSGSFFDLARVEVLKGPQGTLYGQSSTGGAINVISNQPKNVFEASADLTVGDFNTRRTTGVVNVPLTDSIAIRAAVNYNVHDAYTTQLGTGAPVANDQNDLTSRISLLWSINDDMSLLLRQTNGSIGGLGPGGVLYDSLLTKSTGADQRQVYLNPFPNRLDDTYSNFGAEFNWTFGPAHLTYVGAYYNYSADEYSTTTSNPLANNNIGQPYSVPTYLWRQYNAHFLTDSHEVRIANSTPGPFDWVAGLTYYHENSHESDHNWSAASTGTGYPNSVTGYPQVSDSLNGIDPLNQTLHTAKGVFAQTTWHATSALDLTLGLRYTNDSVERHGTFAPGPYAPPPLSASKTPPFYWPTPDGKPCIAPADCVGFPNNGSESDSKTTYKVGAAWHFTDTQMLYANVATGFKGGGFNDSDPRANGGPYPYGPETLTSYEIGYKGRPAPNFEFNSDLFYYDYSARQTSGLISYNGQLVIVTEVVPAKIYGWENDLTWRATPSDEIGFSMTLLKSKYVALQEKDPAGNAVDLSGRDLDNTPTFVGNLRYNHYWNVANGATVRAHLDFKYSSSYLETNLGPYISYTQPSFTRTSADIRYTAPNGKFYGGAYVQNIEKKLQITTYPTGTPVSGLYGSQNVPATDPRTFGVTMGVKF